MAAVQELLGEQGWRSWRARRWNRAPISSIANTSSSPDERKGERGNELHPLRGNHGQSRDSGVEVSVRKAIAVIQAAGCEILMDAELNHWLSLGFGAGELPEFALRCQLILVFGGTAPS